MTDTILTNSRYPGIRAFEKSEQRVFYGREQEKKKLFSLVKAKSLSVLFSKSGLGKSSLINAGLEPLLEKDHFQSVKIRLQNTGLSPIETVKASLEPFLNKEKLEKHTHADYGLWEYLRACEFSKNDEVIVPVLIFDQFEEFFEHSKSDQEALNRELADMVSERLPARIQDHLRSIPFRERSPQQLEWHTPMPVKILLAIRSDRISQLDEMSTKIPSILQNRFHLKPLNIDNARSAIVRPAKLDQDGFDTPPFTYDEKALQTILSYLKNKNEEIESFQLQLLCHYIEKNVYKKQKRGYSVVEADFGGSKGIKSILNNYYEAEIEELEPAERPLARKFIEEGLIVGGRRVGISEGVEQQNFGITPEILTKLLKSRIIRAENTHLGRSFELSHDTLVAPILESYDIRRREEEKLAAKLEREKQEALLASERKKRRRAMLLAAGAIILCLIAIAGGLYAKRQSAIADRALSDLKKEQKKTERAREAAEKAFGTLQNTQFEMAQTYLQNGMTNMELGRYTDAIEDFEVVTNLQNIITENQSKLPENLFEFDQRIFDTADSLKTLALKEGGIQKQFNKLMEEGRRALDRGKFIAAITNFRVARELNLNATANTDAELEIRQARIKLLPIFKQEVARALSFLQADDCDFVKEPVRTAENMARHLIKSDIEPELRTIQQIKQACK